MLTLAAVALGVVAGSGSAAIAASCGAQPIVSASALADFKEKPATVVLGRTPAEIEKSVADLVREATDSADAILKVTAGIPSDAKLAVARGLGTAAISCQAFTPLEVYRIQQMVIALNDAELLAEFVKTIANPTTASIGFGLGGSPSGIGAGLGSGRGTGRRPVDNASGGGGNDQNFITSTSFRSIASGDFGTRASRNQSP